MFPRRRGVPRRLPLQGAAVRSSERIGLSNPVEEKVRTHYGKVYQTGIRLAIRSQVLEKKAQFGGFIIFELPPFRKETCWSRCLAERAPDCHRCPGAAASPQ